MPDNPEEIERLKQDALKKMNFGPEPSPEEVLIKRLDSISLRISQHIQRKIAVDGFVRDRKAMMREVASLYMEELRGLDHMETTYLLSAFLAGHMLSRFN